MFNKKFESTKSMKGITALAKRATVILLSFMMAIQVVPFSMYGNEGVISHAIEGNVVLEDESPIVQIPNQTEGCNHI